MKEERVLKRVKGKGEEMNRRCLVPGFHLLYFFLYIFFLFIFFLF